MGALLNRYADKDLHYIVYLSDELGFNKIVELYDNYRDTINKNHEYFGCFVDHESELIKDDPTQLLWFDKRFKTTRLDSVKILPTHKNNQLNLLKHSKTKDECLFKYKSYCRGYYSSINKPYPITAEVRKKKNKGLY